MKANWKHWSAHCLLLLGCCWVTQAASEALPECVHWTSAFVFNEFTGQATVTGEQGQRLYLHKANPQLCDQENSGMGAECETKSYIVPGDKVTIGHICGTWAYVEFRSKKSYSRGWVEARRLEKIAESGESKAEQDRKFKSDNRLTQALRSEPIGEVIDLVDSGKENKNAVLGAAVALSRSDVVLAMLQRGTNPNTDPKSCQLMLDAKNDIKILQALIDAGMDVNCTTVAERYTPLMAASWVFQDSPVEMTSLGLRKRNSSPLEAVKLLIKSGANVNAIDVFGQTALRSAISRNNVDIATFLLKSGADVNNYIDDSKYSGVEQRGDTALMDAIGGYSLRYDPTMIRLLLEHKADVNVRNRKPYDEERISGSPFAGQTALTKAASYGALTIVKLLLQYGADPLLSRDDGALPADIARQNGHLDVAEVIERFAKSKNK
jgi:ankyrin repeat protein